MNELHRLRESWVPLGDPAAKRFNEQLRLELTDSHPLCTLTLCAAARSEASDDVLYRNLFNQEWVLVHLTWAQTANADYPKYRTFNTIEEFITYAEAHQLFNEE
ncbi:hypothetical protein Q5741_14435 [Paenibacillus sp. JX-17]|uniref:Uncharacterized protein n=1 Tax=Paenibacillus lacisoli TaxID=3064525 RepID=A0ABT9CE98_9BACL|nr:hypothetical protein [Paenibacillus sp. JX-17]MDO7907604.1 hypothetical protein [Paenibacillus sp. JX-17]